MKMFILHSIYTNSYDMYYTSKYATLLYKIYIIVMITFLIFYVYKNYEMITLEATLSF